MYDFDEIISREGTDSIKYDLINKEAKYPKDTIPMFIADMDFSCPPEVLEAINLRLSRRILGYTAVVDDEYYDILKNWYKTRFSWTPSVKPVISHGVVSALNALVKIITSPGDGVIIFTPSYTPFKNAVLKAGERECVYCPLKYESGKYSIDFELFENLCKKAENKLFILCNPHNPTGRLWSKDELEKIGKICFDNNVFVISDEIHADLTRIGSTVIPFASLFEGKKETAVCTAPSKTFNLAGMQLSNIFIYDDKALEEWNRLYGAMPNPLSLEAAKAAYSKCGPWLDELRSYLDKNFEWLTDYFAKELPKAVCDIPEATYLAWADLSAYCDDNEKLEEIIAKNGALVEGGHQFVDNARGFIRINCACPLSVLKEGARRIVSALRQK